jgi:hypothetical protein
MVIIISTLPQPTLGCTQMTNKQRHALFLSYLLSNAPHILGLILFVIPLTSFKKEFGKKCFNRYERRHHNEYQQKYKKKRSGSIEPRYEIKRKSFQIYNPMS